MGKVFIFHTVITEARFQRQKQSKTSQDSHKSSHTPASITTSLQASIFSMFKVPQVTKGSIEWVPWIGDWREVALTKPMEKTLQPPQFTPSPFCDPSCEPAPIPCWSMVKNALLFWWSSLTFLFQQKNTLFSLFFLFHLAFYVFTEGGSVPSSTTVKHKTLLRASTKK